MSTEDKQKNSIPHKDTGSLSFAYVRRAYSRYSKDKLKNFRKKKNMPDMIDIHL